MSSSEALDWGFYNKISNPEDLLQDAYVLANSLAQGPTFAHSMTKNMLNQEWAMTIDQAIEAEAQAQAICMQTNDFKRAYNAFAAKSKPEFEGD
jgi:enoyl-CoA hydratase/carnithine racemase